MLSFVHLVVPAIFLSYLLTLSPTILWRDTPEFANVAFTLSIAHPAGFPTYSLLVKPLTLIPLGSIAFRTNLASAIFALFSALLLIVSLRLFIRRLYPSAPSADIEASSSTAGLLFALGPIVWHNTILAEVYTLNTLFIAGLIYLILRWLDGFDSRWLYLSAFLYGLSAGNHAAVALFLPGLLGLYLLQRPRSDPGEWIRAIFFFLLGLSVYLYLPVRSLANPPYDWGHPQSLKNFLYQITDQKDFGPGGFLSESNAGFRFHLILNHLGLIARQFSPVGIALILLGVVPALRGERGLSLLFLWVLFSNHTFFWAWTSGDAFLPSYLALAFFLGLGTCSLLGIARRWSEVTSSRLREPIVVGLIGFMVVHVFSTYPRVNHRDYYFPADFFRPAFRSLDPRSVFLTEIQWSHIKYLQEIERLREDVSLLSLSEINQPSAFHYITPQRHPGLIIPPLPQVSENRPDFITELVAQNSRAGRPIFREFTERLNQNMVFPILPHRDFIFRVSMKPGEELTPEQIAPYLRQIEDKLFNTGAARQTAHDPDLHLYLDHYISVLAQYLDSHRHYQEAIRLLRLYLQIYGPPGTRSISDENSSLLYNSLGLSELHQGEILNGLKSLDLAIRYDPQNTQPYLNLTHWSLENAPARFGPILERARGNGLDPKEICVTLTEYLLKQGQADLFKRAQALCRKNIKEND